MPHYALHWGLSPLARGNHDPRPETGVRLGPIPARAGEPRRRASSRPTPWAYPRSRGGTRGLWCRITCNWGLSPLARGNLGAVRHAHAAEGPIPARAGEPDCFQGSLML